MQPRPKKLSDRQQCIMDFIRSYLREHGYPPAIREIQQACHISSTSVVDYNLHILQREGFLRRSPEVSRGIELLGPRRAARGADATLQDGAPAGRRRGRSAPARLPGH